MPPMRHQIPQKPKDFGRTIRRIVTYLFRQKWLMLTAILLVLVSSGATIFGTYMLRPLINRGIVPLIGTEPTLADLRPLILMIGLVAAVYLCGALANFAYNRIMVTISNHILKAVRMDLFGRLQELPIHYFDVHTHGELMSRFTNDVDTLRNAINTGFVQFISSSVSVAGTFVMMLILSPLLTLLVMAMVAVILLILSQIGKRSRRQFRLRQAALGRVNGFMEEHVVGQKVVKVFRHERATKAEFDALNEELREVATAANAYGMMMMPLVGNLSYINYAVVASAGAALCIFGQLDIGTVGAFLQYSRSFFQPITQVSQEFNTILSALAGAERIFEVIDTEPERDEGTVTLVHTTTGADGQLQECAHRTGRWAWKQPQPDGSARYVPVRGHVVLDKVDFAYEPDHPVLRQVSLYAKPGQKIAFVGSTGAGKTTITNLLNRFYEVPAGKIFYDGIDITAIRKDDLRRSLAMVLQDTHLFTGTVRENIRYGRLDATDEEIVEAAKLANAHPFIEHLPHGYDTLLTDDGANLSQGQRQLLSIARAAVANPPVLILDEATSSVDTRTEALIEQGMDSLMAGRTTFVIAHRLSTVRNANAILVLEHGEIIERGDHDDLIRQKGRYYQLYTGQFELD